MIGRAIGLRINDYDLSAVTNLVNDWQSKGLFASYDVASRNEGCIIVILQNIFHGDESAFLMEIHKLGKKAFFGVKTRWFINLAHHHYGGGQDEMGCVEGSMLVVAIKNALNEVRAGYPTRRDLDTAVYEWTR